MKVSVALRPTPTTSSFGECIMMVLATVKDARKFSKAGRTFQLKRVVRQRARPQITRNKNRTAAKSAAGAQCKDIRGTRAIAAKITNTLVARITSSQSSALREG